MNQRSSKCLKIFTVEIELKAILLLYKQKEKKKKDHTITHQSKAGLPQLLCAVLFFRLFITGAP